MESEDPRATVIKNVAEQQEILQTVLKQIPPLQSLTFDNLIESFEKCFQIREEPQFIQALFNKPQLYRQFIKWILEPLKMVQERQKANKEKFKNQWKQKYPYLCMQIAKQNPSFYQNMYLKAFFDENFLWRWFQFLGQQNPETVETSLGYFAEIMIPFVKYQFSDSSKICDTLAQRLQSESVISSSELVRQTTSAQKERQKLSKQRRRVFLQEQITILKIFSDPLLEHVIQFIEYESIFKFVHNLILASLQENDLKRSKKIFQFFLRRALQVDVDFNIQERVERGPIIDVCSEYILQILNEIYENVNTEKNYRVIFFMDSMVRVQLILSYSERIEISPLMVKENEQRMSASMDFTAIIHEEEAIQYCLKSLSLLLKIYSKMVKNRKSSEQIQRESRYYSCEDHQEDINGQQKVMKQFASQITQVFEKLPQLSNLVKKNQPRALPFSSGQNIKPITLCKYEFFQLIYNCLILAREFPQDFIVDTQKINLFWIVEKYLQQNRWNNIAHKILEKIAYLLIVNNDNFFRTKQMNKNNIADEFLNSIIESFTNKNYVFLNSLRFTTQGNIHTLYVIAKAIIYELKQSHKLANFIHEIDYYKKFVMNDLQTYQTKTFEIKYPADQEQIRKSDRKSSTDSVKLQVDELSIKEIVKKIDVVNKWPVKENKKKNSSIHRSFSYMSDDYIHPQISHPTINKQASINPSEDFLTIDGIHEKQDIGNLVKPQSLLLGKAKREHFRSLMIDSGKDSSQSFSKKDSLMKDSDPDWDRKESFGFRQGRQGQSSITIQYQPDGGQQQSFQIHIGSGKKIPNRQKKPQQQ